MLTRQAVALVGVLIAGLLLGYAFWTPHSEERGQNATPTPASSRALGSAQQQNFTVLRGATEPVPSALQTELRQAQNHTVRTLWLDTAKYVQVGDGIWVANGRDSTCIIQAHGGAVSCVPRDILFRRGVALGVAELGPKSVRQSPEFTVYGIVPNQIRAIKVQIGDKKQVVPIRDNSYWLRASEPIMVKRFER